ncbi:RagB/SusD family nutrient uptake outer membrane protein [Gabonibacter chumensis]|uniref:RagB/SusD family nutrient uptake outer membrane protein n=1 Tax=Gabonibacter chumensis TaxID=2972474 RepID=UPI002572BACD|nr:RagB/SusD family nutrient uptake outer membrane protein [Gabonibacter chumensis]MCR9011547.1 RagB/SusD family nutrient uptake outer membrane protein [Gabonibacter chumensis]
MKKRNIQYHIVWGVCCALILLSGCDSFLDVQPKGTVEQKKQFEDVQGYRDAMYGVYASMAKPELYGKSLSYGFTDQIGQLFYANYIGSNPDVFAASKFDYKSQYLEGTIRNIWEKAYEVISYVNNVIENVEKEDDSKDEDFALVKGEAYAVRAFLHFDIMRLFSDNILRHPDAGGIPYATVFGLENKPVYTLKECYDRVLSDLQKAQETLVNDKIIRDNNANSVYQVNRRSHCNQYAVWAIKARVFHYKGDLDSAALYAEKVIGARTELALTNVVHYEDVKRYSRDNTELIWGLYTSQLYDTYYNLFLASELGAGDVLWIKKGIKDFYEIGSASADDKDKRFNAFFTEEKKDGGNYIFTRLLGKEEKAYNFTGVCLIRLPEMYYILAEVNYEKDKVKALGYLNTVRRTRGIKDIPLSQISSSKEFQAILVKERCKEFWGEGQVFFSYKRDHMPFMNATNDSEVAPSSAIFNLPWPKNEQEYGTTNQ